MYSQVPIITSARACIKAVQEIAQNPIVALDCEGVNLSRTGRLCLIQVATPKRVYLFDVLKGGYRLFFEKGLKGLLENRKIIKIVHDCRRDSEALWYQFGVHLQGVWDSQVAYAILSQLKGNKTPYPVGLNTLFRLCGVEDNKFKDTIKSAMTAMRNFWEVRPLSRMMIDYAAADVKSLLSVYSMINAELILHDTEYNFKKIIEEYSSQYVLMNISEPDGADLPEIRVAKYNYYGIKMWDEDIGLGTRDTFFEEYKAFDKSICPVVTHTQVVAAAREEEEAKARGSTSGSDSERSSSDEEGSTEEEQAASLRVRRYEHSQSPRGVYVDGYQRKSRYNHEQRGNGEQHNRRYNKQYNNNQQYNNNNNQQYEQYAGEQYQQPEQYDYNEQYDFREQYNSNEQATDQQGNNITYYRYF